MKLKLALLAAAATLAVAGPAAAHDVIYTATLKGSSEVPGNASPGVGNAIVTINDDTFQMRVQVIFAGLTGTTTASHIHCCTAPGANAGVATPVPTFPNFPLGVTTGSYDQSFNMALLSSYNPAFLTANNLGSAGQAFSFFTTGMATGQAYLNIHTSAFAGGEIRGTLTAVPAVPEPETYALMFAGLGVVGMVAARRRRAG